MSRRRPELTAEDLEQEAVIAKRKGIPLCELCGHHHQPGLCQICDCGHRHHIVPRHELRRRRRNRQKAIEREREFTRRARLEEQGKTEAKRLYKKKSKRMAGK
jgi:hypothetical protein